MIPNTIVFLANRPSHSLLFQLPIRPRLRRSSPAHPCASLASLSHPSPPRSSWFPRRHHLPLLFGGFAAYASATYAAFVYYRMSNAPRPDGVERLDWQENKREVFDTIAARYDKEIDWDEFLMGMKLLRWWLMRKAKGDTLEVSAGTGRNLPFYPRSALRSLTVTDVSIPMLQQAQSKFSPLQATFHSSEPNTTDPKQPHPLPTRFVPASAASLPAPSASFDTVVQSFGLCSQADPVRALQEIQRVCKPDGTILLLEHGRSHYAWLDDLLDRTAMSHADKWGCWYNRDVADILNRSGLEVIEMGRWHFGTTWWVVAKPGKGVTTK